MNDSLTARGRTLSESMLDSKASLTTLAFAELTAMRIE